MLRRIWPLMFTTEFPETLNSGSPELAYSRSLFWLYRTLPIFRVPASTYRLPPRIISAEEEFTSPTMIVSALLFIIRPPAAGTVKLLAELVRVRLAGLEIFSVPFVMVSQLSLGAVILPWLVISKVASGEVPTTTCIFPISRFAVGLDPFSTRPESDWKRRLTFEVRLNNTLPSLVMFLLMMKVCTTEPVSTD